MSTFTAINLPEAGQRVGTVCGPCERAKDNAGTVLCQVTDRWGTHSLVLMDSGETKTCHGLTKIGIGWHAI
jgi:hypothetical protein